MRKGTVSTSVPSGSRCRQFVWKSSRDCVESVAAYHSYSRAGLVADEICSEQLYVLPCTCMPSRSQLGLNKVCTIRTTPHKSRHTLEYKLPRSTMHHFTLKSGMPGEATSSADTAQEPYRGAAGSTARSRLQPPASAWQSIYLPGDVPRTDIEA